MANEGIWLHSQVRRFKLVWKKIINKLLADRLKLTVMLMGAVQWESRKPLSQGLKRQIVHRAQGQYKKISRRLEQLSSTD